MCKSKLKKRNHLVQFEVKNLKKIVRSMQNVKLQQELVKQTRKNVLFYFDVQLDF